MWRALVLTAVLLTACRESPPNRYMKQDEDACKAQPDLSWCVEACRLQKDKRWYGRTYEWCHESR